MNKTSKTIIFFGTSNFSLVILESLINAGYEIKAIVTKPDSKSGRGHKLNSPIVKDFGIAHNIPVWQPDKVSDINGKILAEYPTKPVGVLASYGKIIPESTLQLFNPGIINVHPSLLPKYRGSTPIESAILNGDRQTGISIMLLVHAMDAGPIFFQKACDLTGQETQPSLYDSLAHFGAILLTENIDDIIAGKLKATPQNDDQASYCKPLTKDDQPLAPSHLTAKQAEQKVRAHITYPHTTYNLNSKNSNGNIRVIITSSHTSDEPNGPISIKCIDNRYLIVDTLIAPSGRNMQASAFYNGYLR